MRITSLTCRFVAAALLAATLAACSGDDSASLPSTTRVTEDPKVVAHDRMCQALQLYVAAEQRRLSGPVADPSTPPRLEANRQQALANLDATLTPEVPPTVKEALSQLRGMPIEAPAESTTTEGSAAPTTTVSPAAAPLEAVTNGLDPLCGTKGGEPTTTSTTTAGTTTPATSATSAPGATTTTAGASTTAATSATSSPATSTTSAA